jgi:hypothetical protein
MASEDDWVADLEKVPGVSLPNVAGTDNSDFHKMTVVDFGGREDGPLAPRRFPNQP